MFDPISKYLMSCYFMRYLVGLLAFYLFVVALYQCSDGGWEEIKNIFWGRYQYLTEILNMRYSRLSFLIIQILDPGEISHGINKYEIYYVLLQFGRKFTLSM